ncbi:26340_t:CDS:1 [Racocetra persica]|uniref:26340_t:CDS:1 n=1 Tax=Racocetra persica TaxID=160502 RepID=A0ACA9P7D9_9GLOM|nr:26340_t:CDS:1 [Racocetra persica]
MQPYLNLLSFVKVNKSLSELNSTFEKLLILVKKCGATNFTLSNEYKVNNIVISLSHTDDGRNRAFVDYANKLNPIIVYSDNSKKPKKPKIEMTNNSSILKSRQIEHLVLGGDGIHNIGFTSVCSAGFWVRTTNGSTYLASAGHCASNGPFNPDEFVDFYHLPWDSEVTDLYIGPMVSHTISGVDRGFILKQNDIRAVPIIRNTDDTEYPELHIIGTVDLDTVGTIVCKSGYFADISRVQCGEIIAINAEITMGGEKYSVVKVTNMGCDGNSGAPVHQYLNELLPNVLLAGMLIGGNNHFCEVVPLNLILTEGIHVITVNNP